MLVFPKQNLALLAVPKTGTTAIEKALMGSAGLSLTNVGCGRHMGLSEVRRKFPSVETVALIRNPISWVSSWYRYRTTTMWASSDRHTLGKSFPQFIDKWAAGQTMWANPEGNDLQSDYLVDGSQQVDHLFAYEKMGDFVSFLSQRLGTGINLPKINVSPSMPTAVFPRIETIIEEHASADFALYKEVTQHALQN